MQVRLYHKADQAAMESLIRQVCEEDWPGYPTDMAVEELGIADTIYIAEDSGKIVGFIGLNKCKPYRVMHIQYLAVEKESRRHGVGRLLIEAAEKEARGLNKEVLRVYTGIRAKWAQEFYKSCGFKESGRVKNYEYDGDKVVFYTKVVR